MERNAGIDLLRIISAAAVIIIHVVSAPLANSAAVPDAALTGSLQLLHTLLNWCVPVFFMITGFCQLQKEEVT